MKKQASRFIKAFINIDIDPECCVPVTGSMQGTYASFLTAGQCTPGKDTILFIDPGFPVQKQQIAVMGYKYESFDVYEYRGERLREALETHLSKVAALYQGTPVAGASSYTVYRGGIEIDTRVDFRRQGLATACGARLILNCLERGLYPSWDAHSRASLSLAEKLGYKLDRPYPAYEYTIGSPAPTVQSAGAMR